MTQDFDRKAALRSYKERKVRPGIYAVRNRQTGRAWAGSAPDVDACKNGLWHTLLAGRHLDKSLQAEWNHLGQDAFDFVVLETIEEEMTPLVLKETLKAKKAEWSKALADTPLGNPSPNKP
jgi:hypothetical protein